MKNRIISQLIILTLLFSGTFIQAQGLLDKIDNELSNENLDEIATFKTTRIGLGHSIETRKKGALEISLYNRYWNIPDFAGQRFLADKVSTRFGLDYAFSDNFSLGGGYTNFDKITDGYLKYRLFRQKKSSEKLSLSVTLLQAASFRNIKNENANLYEGNTNVKRYAFTSQVLIARKFNPNFSLQLAPTFIYSSEKISQSDPTSQFALGFGGRHKISGHASIVSEYYYVANPLKSLTTYNTFMVGINWELSHLLLQFHVTNARNYAEDTFITQTINNFNAKDGNFHFGFNATFVLHTKKRKLKL